MMTTTNTTVLDNWHEMLDDSAGRWSAVCNEHGNLVATETRSAAREAARAPWDFCEDCEEPAPLTWDDIDRMLANR